MEFYFPLIMGFLAGFFFSFWLITTAVVRAQEKDKLTKKD